jgi:DeoR family transcriptional regulator of aga operon
LTPTVNSLALGHDEVGAPAELRQDRMAEAIDEIGFARVTYLAQRFGVSEVTVRSDLHTLESEGRLRRVRGGAVPAGALRNEPTLEQAVYENQAQKAAVARYAASTVQSGQCIILDVGSTTTAIARQLAARRDLQDVTVVTNGLSLALELEPAADRLSVLVTGGMVRPRQHSLVSPFADLVLGQVSAHTAFIGCNGVDVEGGITNLNFAEAEVKRAMIQSAREVVVVADGSKLGLVEAARVCGISDIDAVVTDTTAAQGITTQLEQAGVAVHRASPP